MQNTQKITERILSEAEEAAKNVVDAAKAEAEANLKQAEERAEMLIKQAKQDAALAAEEHKERRLSAIDSELRRNILAVRRNLLDSVFDKALSVLKNKSANEKIDMFAQRVIKASPEGKGEIMLTARDKSEIGEKLLEAVKKLYGNNGIKADIKISDKSIDASGGFILKTGDIEINNTFETLIKASKGDIEGEIASILFPDDSGKNS